MNCFIELIQKSDQVDQGEFDPFVDIYLEADQNVPKMNQNDPYRIKTK